MSIDLQQHIILCKRCEIGRNNKKVSESIALDPNVRRYEIAFALVEKMEWTSNEVF